MADTVNEHFNPWNEVTKDQVTFAAGVTALNESITLALCDPGDFILLGQPAYGSFGNDLIQRTGCVCEADNQKWP
jgi:1-aminocyclopropane-1-carboxylate synthase